MNRDIAGRADIEFLLEEFYSTALTDAVIGHHFNEIDLPTHLPIITDFWEKVLFGNPVYFGNPLAIHRDLHRKNPIRPEHFHRWLMIFDSTIDKHFAGEMAQIAKNRARAIADSLLNRLDADVLLQPAT